MASRCGKGEIFLLAFLSFVVVSSAEAEAGSVRALLDRQEEQLNKLQELVEALSRTVARLESATVVPDASPERFREVEVGSMNLDGSAAPGGGGGSGDGRRLAVGGISVTKGRPLWFENFQLLAAARLEVEATCAFVLPYTDHDGLSKYFALGDSQGRIFVFSSAGDVLVESSTPTASPVTVMLSYLSIRKNESLLFTGHADGSVVGHRVWESAANGEDWLTVSIDSPRVLFCGGEHETLPPMATLEVHQIGRVRYVVSSDEAGRIRVFTENGTLYGTATASRRPLAFMKQRMLFLTESGAGWLDLRRMTVRETNCKGLNGSVVKSFTFDVLERSKAYGFTSGGDLIHVMLLGDAANAKCRVRAVKKSDIEGSVSVLAIKGYLLVVNHEKVFLHNVSSQYYSRIGASRPLLFATLSELKSLFLNSQGPSDGSAVGGKPLIAGDHEKLVVLGLGDGYIGIYRSNFPVLKTKSNAVLWSSPALLFLMFLIGMWYLYVKKKGSMGWTPDEAFATPGGVAARSSLLGPVAGDRAFADAQRAGDLRDVRGGMLRGPTRRYASPSSRFPGGTTLSYRPTSADPGFGGGGAELQYRGPAVEPPGYSKRREPIFANNHVLDDHID